MISLASHDLIAVHCAPSMLLLRKLHAVCKEKETSREGYNHTAQNLAGENWWNLNCRKIGREKLGG